ncbi:unnamed protein product [Schistosoma mattheei]|uniref:Uncharacterized protein n=1 Tax=Schistosoma mattheei TaxID=31246 RepID=A0A3P8FVF6_9TREM|nr:unnamed protein product [Schistosoma mattheei]
MRPNARPIKSTSGVLTSSSGPTLDKSDTLFSRPGQQHVLFATSADETSVSRSDQQTTTPLTSDKIAGSRSTNETIVSRSGRRVRLLVIQLLSDDFSVVQSVPSLSSDFLTAKTDVIDTGQYFYSSVSSFLSDPANESHQSGVCRSINALLAALSRLLILADIADSLVLNQQFEAVLSGITEFQSVSSHAELSRLWNTFYPHVLQLISLSKKRASDLIDLEDRRKIESANYVLKNNTPLLHTSCKVVLSNIQVPEVPIVRFTTLNRRCQVCLRYPDNLIPRDSRTFVSNSLSDAVELIQSVFNGISKSNGIRLRTSGKLLEALDEFEVIHYVVMN